MTYEELGSEIGKLVESKQAAYGDSFGKSGDIMRILYPSGISPEKMDDALCLVRIIDKMMRIATDRDALGESPYRDVAGYALLGAARVERTRELPKFIENGPGVMAFNIRDLEKLKETMSKFERRSDCSECGQSKSVNEEGWCSDCFNSPTKRQEEPSQNGKLL